MSISITVLESNDMEFLFGLDMLKRHQCCIDLKTNVLRFGSCDLELPFLAEHELPEHIRKPHDEELAARDAPSTSSAAGKTPLTPPRLGLRQRGLLAESHGT